MAFEPINTQEEFDAAISDRIKREREKFADYNQIKQENADLKKQVGDLQKGLDDMTATVQTNETTVTELNGKIKDYENASLKARIAHEYGIPYELAGRLAGDDEKAIKADAESLSKLVSVGTKKPVAPLKTSEPAPTGDSKNASYKALLNGLKGDE